MKTVVWVLCLWFSFFVFAEEWSLGMGKPLIGGYFRSTDQWHKDWGIEKIPFDYYSQIIHFGHLNYNSETGEANAEPGFWPDRQLVSLCRQEGAQAILCPFIFGGEVWERICKSIKDTEEFADAIVNLMDDYDYDGIDIDWEHVTTPEAGRRWGGLIQCLRRKIDIVAKRKQRQHYLTVALMPGEWVRRNLDMEVILNNVDLIHMMTYDMSVGYAGNTAPLNKNPLAPHKNSYLKISINRWVDAGIPKSRIMVGLAFYSPLYENCLPYEKLDPENGKRKIEQIPYVDLSRIVEKEKWFSLASADNSEVCYISPDGKRLAVMDGPEQIRMKTEWCYFNDFGGVFCWSIRCDARDYSLAKAMSSPWRK
ncbi:glycosyl hydrolase family 18 protein [Tichowtungia aerotolerans]|uniref:chitinase n=1 Tax=Tichowtungia aerotolerans TaxID=2697043 RepID=A0A6P1M7V3_9BACT|nr:glycosyl hydrolase family 18 protein [Tichowtungia aerotolerans]QHI70670.1 hypothetical protein GT409_14890 [Tichowtungia aerotolerans]